MVENVGHYKLLDQIAAGAAGDVYKARDTRHGRTVAIKVLRGDLTTDRAAYERLESHARAAAALSHPNIATLYEIGEDSGRVFLAFEYAPGETLARVISGRPMNTRRAVDLAAQIADALAEAHAGGVIHGAITTSSIIVTPRDKAKILDFGVAEWTSNTGSTGSAGRVSIDERADTSSLGAVLFEMLTGKPPSGPSPASIREVPPELAAIVARALERPKGGYESAATMAAELHAVAAVLESRTTELDDEMATVFASPSRSFPWGRLVWLGVVLGMAAAAVAGGRMSRERLARMWHHTIAGPPAPVIALISLADTGTDGSQYLAEGLTDDLASRLGQTPGLRVVGRSSIRTNRGERSPRDVAADLGAHAVLAGSMKASGSSISLSLELIDPSDGSRIWKGELTRELGDITAAQVEIATQIAQALHVRPQPTPWSVRAAARHVDPSGYKLYLQGRQALSLRRVREAIDDFQRATVADAGLAEAFAALGDAIRSDSADPAIDGEAPAHSDSMTAAVERAYQLDPDLPPANVAMGLAAPSMREALTFFKHAIDVDPSFAEAYLHAGERIQAVDPSGAVALFRKAIAADRRLEASYGDLSMALLLLGRDDEARHVVEGRADATRFLAALDLDERRYADAATHALAAGKLREKPAAWLQYIVALRSAGRGDEALQEATELTRRFPDVCSGRALAAGLLEEHGSSAAARRMRRAITGVVQRDPGLIATIECSAVAAAAGGDARQAAAALDRISEIPTLEAGAPGNNVNNVHELGQSLPQQLRGRAYPWSNVIEAPAVVAAKGRVESAFARQREIARSVLGGLLE